MEGFWQENYTLGPARQLKDGVKWKNGREITKTYDLPDTLNTP